MDLIKDKYTGQDCVGWIVVSGRNAARRKDLKKNGAAQRSETKIEKVTTVVICENGDIEVISVSQLPVENNLDEKQIKEIVLQQKAVKEQHYGEKTN